jgi:Holliday junction resolvase
MARRRGPSEASIQADVRRYLEQAGFLVIKVHGGPYSPAGLPDLLAIRDSRAYWFEIKKAGEVPTKIQTATHLKLVRAGCLVGVVSSALEARACVLEWQRSGK